MRLTLWKIWYVYELAWERLGISLVKLVEVADEREIWDSLLVLP